MPTTALRENKIFINRYFALFWIGRLISTLGDSVFDAILVLWIVAQLIPEKQLAPIAVSGVLLAASSPSVIVGPLAGVFVDRWSRRLVMLWTDLIRAFLIFFLAFAVYTHIFSQLQMLTVIYSIVFLASICSQFFNPASIGFMTELIDKENIPQAWGFLQTSASVTTFIGPALGSLLFFSIGIQWAILLNAASFAISLLTLSNIQEKNKICSTDKSKPDSIFLELQEGIRFLIQSQTLRVILIASILVALGGGAISALDVFFVTQNLHTSVISYGFLSSAWGGGMITGAFFTPLFSQRIGIARIFSYSLLLMGILVIIYARMENIIPATIIIFFLGMLMSSVNAVVTPIVLSATPTTILGRIISIITPIVFVASMISIALAGFLDSTLLSSLHFTFLSIHIGPIDTIFMGTGILILFSGIYVVTKIKYLAVSW